MHTFLKYNLNILTCLNFSSRISNSYVTFSKYLSHHVIKLMILVITVEGEAKVTTVLFVNFVWVLSIQYHFYYIFHVIKM